MKVFRTFAVYLKEKYRFDDDGYNEFTTITNKIIWKFGYRIKFVKYKNYDYCKSWLHQTCFNWPLKARYNREGLLRKIIFIEFVFFLQYFQNLQEIDLSI